MDVNIEIDELVVDGTGEAGLEDRLGASLDPVTARAVARAVAEAARGTAAPSTSG